MLSAVTKMAEPVKKKQKTIYLMLKKVPNTNKQPSKTSSAPSLKNISGSSKAKSCRKDVLNAYEHFQRKHMFLFLTKKI